VHLLFGRIGDADPDEFALFLGAVDLLVDRDRPDPLPVAVEVGGDDRHGPFYGRQATAPRRGVGEGFNGAC